MVAAPYAATGHITYVDGYDLTGDLSKVDLGVSWEALDATVFTTSTTPARVRKAGLQVVDATVNGYADFAAGGVDGQMFTGIGSTAHVVTHAPTATEGVTAYFYQARTFSYKTFGEIGQLVPFTANLQSGGTNGAYGAVRGQLLKAKANVSATGATGTAVQLGAAGATDYLYAVLHVIGTPGTTITVVLESDDASNFPSPTTRVTFGPITTTGGTFATRVAGAITDTWYRLRVTAITGTFTIAGAAGIQDAR